MNRTQKPSSSAADTITEFTVTPALILRGAACYLELHGWIQGDFYGEGRPFPAADTTGALGMAAHGTITDLPVSSGPNPADCHRAWRYLLGYLAAQGQTTDPQDTNASIAEWNDDIRQTGQKVIATLRAAADEYDWEHASEDDVETYADSCTWSETWPTREGFLAWLAARS